MYHGTCILALWFIISMLCHSIREYFTDGTKKLLPWQPHGPPSELVSKKTHFLSDFKLRIIKTIIQILGIRVLKVGFCSHFHLLLHLYNIKLGTSLGEGK